MNALEIVRVSRGNKGSWASAKSWLGGFPTLGASPWPRASQTGKPLHFLAQIRVSDLPVSMPGMPDGDSERSLLFFANTDFDSLNQHPEFEVVVVETEGEEAVSHPPEDTDPVFGSDYPHTFAEATSYEKAPRSFGRWPIDFEPFQEDAGPEFAGGRDAVLHFRSEHLAPLFQRSFEIIREHLANGIEASKNSRSDYNSWIEKMRSEIEEAKTSHDRDRKAEDSILYKLLFRGGNSKIRENSRHAHLQYLADKVRRLELEVKEAESNERKTSRFIQAQDDLVSRIFAGSGFENADIEALEKRYLGLRSMVSTFVSEQSYVKDLEKISKSIILAAATGPEDEYENVPSDIREQISISKKGDFWRHQMFGFGANVHGHREDGEDVLLLQLSCDSAMRWDFGDGGYIQFRVDLDDFRKGKWDGVYGVFEAS